jgi:hypothetical protein
MKKDYQHLIEENLNNSSDNSINLVSEDKDENRNLKEVILIFNIYLFLVFRN